MIKIEETSGVPIYLQIVSEVKRKILTGVFSSDHRLPSIRDLAVELKVNPNTVAKAYQELESQGVIYFKRGQGAYVSPKTNEDKMKEARTEIEKRILEILEIAKSLEISKMEIMEIFKKHLDKFF